MTNVEADTALDVADGETLWKRAPRMIEILDAVCAAQRLGRMDVMSPRRVIHLVYARNLFYFLCLRLTIRGYSEIGRFMGGRDHSTVWHGEGVVLQRMPEYLPRLRLIADALGREITDEMLQGRRGNEPIISRR